MNISEPEADLRGYHGMEFEARIDNLYVKGIVEVVRRKINMREYRDMVYLCSHERNGDHGKSEFGDEKGKYNRWIVQGYNEYHIEKSQTNVLGATVQKFRILSTTYPIFN